MVMEEYLVDVLSGDLAFWTASIVIHTSSSIDEERSTKEADMRVRNIRSFNIHVLFIIISVCKFRINFRWAKQLGTHGKAQK